MSYNNNLHMVKRIAAELPKEQRLVVFYNPRLIAAAFDLKAFGIETHPLKPTYTFALSFVPMLMSARVIFIDNYYALISGLFHPQKKMKIVQLWHADGSLKRFGVVSPKFKNQSHSKKIRHQRVYNACDEYVTASVAMAEVFQTSFKQPFNKMQFLGAPRSDRLFSEKWLKTVQRRVYNAAPELENKRVILYAPTYRPASKINPPVGTMKALASDPNAVVAVKLYQNVDRERLRLAEFNLPNVKIYDEFTTTDLMSIADTFVTDYSSYAFDYSLMPHAHSMIFYMYDMEDYERNPGIQTGFEEWLPSKPIKDIVGLKAAIIKNEKVDFKDFNQMWNYYNDGNAYQRVIDRYVLNK
ncbi:CDP-glycerol glycerophosphotransferase family protein [Fructilactobacillus vespulae]|uniref:CDP-glycerol glycerophosphotransferase family protein n=1 Tax=Fructilactobacillus vespulae TaxID=1249630 RepID=UPI0039B51470